MKTRLLPLLLLLLSLQGLAQIAMTVAGNMQIHNNASVNVLGNFSITAAGTFVNNGVLYAKGNISNNQPAMVAGSGALHLNGNSAQTISGTTFKTNNLNSNNAAGILLATSLSVSGVHTFSAGMVTTSGAANYLIYESGASYSGDNDARHVNGGVKKIGQTDFIYPVGNAAVERTIMLQALSANSEFGVSYSRTTPNRSQLTSPLAAVDSSEYWQVNKVSGGTAAVLMNWDNSKVPFFNCNVADVRVAGYDGANWSSQGSGAAGSPATTGTITSNILSSFNLFTFGATFVLPLHLLNFNAKRMPDHTAVSWEVSQEKDIAWYVVERSTDGQHYQELGRQTSRNSANDERYSYADFTALNGSLYYRLKWININGSSGYSPVAKISFAEAAENDAVVLKSNPVRDKLVLVASSQLNGAFRYSIYSAGAQAVQSGTLQIEPGGSYSLPLSGKVLPGVYTLTLQDASHNFAIKFVVQ